MVIKRLRQIIKRQEGLALPLVLALLVLGGLTIAPALDYATTSLRSGQTVASHIDGTYAAEAGIEDTLWRLKNSLSPQTVLAETINRMDVTIATVDEGVYTVYLGQIIEAGQHSDYITVDGEIVWDGGAGAYKYTITVTHQFSGSIHLVEVGAGLPAGYSYQAGSAAGFGENLSVGEPSVLLDSFGAYLLNWTFHAPYPIVSSEEPTATQTFYITGTGEIEGEYTWVVANREDIGEVGEITGTLYQITATATDPNTSATTGQIVVDVMVEGNTPHIISWRIAR